MDGFNEKNITINILDTIHTILHPFSIWQLERILLERMTWKEKQTEKILTAMMEKYGKSTRRELLEGFDSADAAWDSYIAMHTGKVAFYDREIELKADYRPRDIARSEDVWRSIASIKEITAANAACVAYAQEIVSREEYRDFQRKY